MKTRNKAASMEKQRQVLCDHLNFIGAEAYKQLRTSLIFSLPKEKDCRIVAVTSADMGDGKSTTSINLANSLAQAGKRVLIVEGDMRLPYMSERLLIEAEPGLSDYLVGNTEFSQMIQKTPTRISFDAITAGSLPPNPSELLTSVRMMELLQALATGYDYILLDLPPLNVVADAAALADVVDGYIMVVRQDKTNMRSVDAAMNKLDIVNGKVLGFVVNDVKTSDSGYKYRKARGRSTYERRTSF